MGIEEYVPRDEETRGELWRGVVEGFGIVGGVVGCECEWGGGGGAVGDGEDAELGGRVGWELDLDAEAAVGRGGREVGGVDAD